MERLGWMLVGPSESGWIVEKPIAAEVILDTVASIIFDQACGVRAPRCEQEDA
jgi:hypothetical protein